jgi:mRNA interferase RelE/StbE
MKTVSYARTAIKALKAMPARDRDAVLAKMDDYAAGGVQDVKPLKGSDLWRLRHGNWRVVFSQDGTVIAVIRIANRREVYR